MDRIVLNADLSILLQIIKKSNFAVSSFIQISDLVRQADYYILFEGNVPIKAI